MQPLVIYVIMSIDHGFLTESLCFSTSSCRLDGTDSRNLDLVTSRKTGQAVTGLAVWDRGKSRQL